MRAEADAEDQQGNDRKDNGSPESTQLFQEQRRGDDQHHQPGEVEIADIEQDARNAELSKERHLDVSNVQQQQQGAQKITARILSERGRRSERATAARLPAR